jgi:hypothetical protein
MSHQKSFQHQDLIQMETAKSIKRILKQNSAHEAFNQMDKSKRRILKKIPGTESSNLNTRNNKPNKIVLKKFLFF